MINDWLKIFCTNWKQHDIASVMAQLADEVEYHESPYQLLANKDEIRHEWQVVLKQKNISIDYEVLSETTTDSTVIWKLSYTLDNEDRDVRGVWIIKLNDEAKCTYFYQVCETK